MQSSVSQSVLKGRRERAGGEGRFCGGGCVQGVSGEKTDVMNTDVTARVCGVSENVSDL